MWLVAGLGNPGKQYGHNRHNVGFMALDALAETFSAGAWTRKFSGLFAEAKAHGFFLLKPQTYMNLSGESVGACVRFYKIPAKQVIVIHDELDLPTGKLRVKQSGGHGGHNGLKSIDAHIGEHYWRVRLGIGPKGMMDAAAYVLQDFSKAEQKVQDEMLALIAKHFPLLLSGDASGFMNKVALETTNRE